MQAIRRPQLLEASFKHKSQLKFLTTDPYYRVILLYNNWRRDHDIAKKVHTSVPPINYTDALKCTTISRKDGRALIITAPERDAVTYRDNLKSQGLSILLDEV